MTKTSTRPCSSCGESIVADARFCKHCGEAVEPDEADEAFAWIPYDGDEAVDADLVDEGDPVHEDDPAGTDESHLPAVEDTDPSASDARDVDRGEPADGAAADDDPTDADADDGSMPDELALANFRRLYETQLKHLTRDQRIGLAQTVTGEVLYALCHDEFPGVIEAILSNPNCGLNHARLVARHHNKAMGLDNVARRTQFLSDALVQRHLLRNVQTPESVLKKLLRMKPLIRLYKLCFGRELSEPAMRAARQTLRSRFQSAPPEETVTLVFTTEGRCLQLLAGIPLDEAFTALFTKRPVNSMLLIQNLLRHGATPPSNLRHLWKQPLLKRQRHLREMLVKHPNCPGEFKRG